MNFLLQRNGQQLGPYPLASLSEMHRAGSVLPSDLIWVEGAPTWVLVSDYSGAKPSFAPSPLPAAGPNPVRSAGGPPPLPPLSSGGDAATVEMVKEVEAGGRFVIFTYCISILVMTFKRPSGIVFLRRDQDGAGDAIRYSLISGLFGWWGFPWGPIWTIAALISNARGGRDVTREVLSDRISPAAAQAILARRQRPAPVGMLMKSFRAALVAVPLLLVGMISLAVMTPSGPRQFSSPGEAAFEAANSQIDVNNGTVAFGNNSQAIAVASDVSRSMKLLRDLGFEGGKKNGLSLSKHEFLTYCDLRQEQCVVLMHVPELRRFTSGAKDSLANLAWGRTQTALRQQNVGSPGMKVVVGMRGIALYDRVMSGQYVADPETKESGLLKTVKDGRDELKDLFEGASRSPALERPATGAANVTGTTEP